MKKTIAIVCLTIGIGSQVTAQSWQWGKTIDPTGAATASVNLAKDALGNVYATGTFQDSVRIGGIKLTGAGGSDVYIAKYDAAGKVIWAKAGGGSNTDGVSNVYVDAANNVYVSGAFTANTTFGTKSLSGTGGYIAKMDASGNVLDLKRMEGTVKRVCVDNAGNTYVAGIFKGTQTFGTITKTSNQSSIDIYVLKYDNTGTILWVKQIQSGGTDDANGIGIDAAGDIYVAGYYNGSSVDFDAGGQTAIGGYDAFVVKYSASGNKLWHKVAGAKAGFCAAYDMYLDASGNSYITGFGHGDMLFDNDTVKLKGQVYSNTFIAKLDATGKVVWADGISADGGTAFNKVVANSISVDADGNSYITGGFEKTIKFGSKSITSKGTKDLFISKFDKNGLIVSTDTKASGDGKSILVTAKDEFYISGTADDVFGTDSVLFSNPFIARYGANQPPTAINNNYFVNPNEINVYPNPTNGFINISLPKNITGATVQIVNVLGETVYNKAVLDVTNVIDLSQIPSGLYVVKISNEELVNTQKLIKQ